MQDYSSPYYMYLMKETGCDGLLILCDKNTMMKKNNHQKLQNDSQVSWRERARLLERGLVVGRKTFMICFVSFSMKCLNTSKSYQQKQSNSRQNDVLTMIWTFCSHLQQAAKLCTACMCTYNLYNSYLWKTAAVATALYNHSTVPEEVLKNTETLTR